MKYAYKILIGNPEGQGILGRPRENNIKMDLKRQEIS
jgi:hypothetical protein